MSEASTVVLRFADEEERARYWRLRADPALHDVMSMGANLAKDHLVPRIQNGKATWRAGELKRQIAGFRKAGRGDLRTQFGRVLTDDEEFMFRVGFDSIALAAKESHERMEQAGEILGEAYGLAMAGIAMTNEALAILGDNPPPAPGRHALDLGARRPLTPADFGVMPSPPAK